MFVIPILILFITSSVIGLVVTHKKKINASMAIPLGFAALLILNQAIHIPFALAKINSLYYLIVACILFFVIFLLSCIYIFKHRKSIKWKNVLITFSVILIVSIFIFLWQILRTKAFSIWDIRTYGSYVNYLADNNPINYYNIGTNNFNSTLNQYNLNGFLSFQSILARIVDFRTLYSFVIYPWMILVMSCLLFSIFRKKMNMYISFIATFSIMLFILFGYQANEYATGTTYAIIYIMIAIYCINLNFKKMFFATIFLGMSFSSTTLFIIFPFIFTYYILKFRTIDKYMLSSVLIFIMLGSYILLPIIATLIIVPLVFILMSAIYFMPQKKLKNIFVYIFILTSVALVTIGAIIFRKEFYWRIWELKGFTSFNDDNLKIFVIVTMPIIILFGAYFVYKLCKRESIIDNKYFAPIITIILMINPLTLTLTYKLFGTAQPRIFTIPLILLIYTFSDLFSGVKKYVSNKTTLVAMSFAVSAMVISPGLFISAQAIKAHQNQKSIFIFSKWSKVNDGFSHEFDSIYKEIMQSSTKDTVVENISKPNSMEKMNLYKPFLNSYNGAIYTQIKKPEIIFGKYADLKQYISTNNWSIKKYKKIKRIDDNFIAWI